MLDTEAGAAARFASAAAAVRSVRPDIAEGTISGAIRHGLLTHPTEGRIANFFVDLSMTSPEEIDAVRRAYFDRMADGLQLFDDARPVLAALRQVFPVALVTNGPSELQRQKIARFHLDEQVDWVVISEEVGFEKPDRAIFEHALGLAGVQAQDAAHLGDSLLTDVAGANDAGMHSIWLRSPLVKAVSGDSRFTPDTTITDFRELVQALPGAMMR